MSTWHEIKDIEDVSISDDGEFLHVNYDSDYSGNIWMEIPIKFIKKLIADDGNIPNSDNVDYLQGLVDGYGGNEPIHELPEGFKDINEVWDRLYELKSDAH